MFLPIETILATCTRNTNNWIMPTQYWMVLFHWLHFVVLYRFFLFLYSQFSSTKFVRSLCFFSFFSVAKSLKYPVRRLYLLRFPCSRSPFSCHSCISFYLVRFLLCICSVHNLLTSQNSKHQKLFHMKWISKHFQSQQQQQQQPKMNSTRNKTQHSTTNQTHRWEKYPFFKLWCHRPLADPLAKIYLTAFFYLSTAPPNFLSLTLSLSHHFGVYCGHGASVRRKKYRFRTCHKLKNAPILQ